MLEARSFTMTEKDLINAAIASSTGAWFETHGRIWAKDRTKGMVTPKQNYLQRKIQAVVDRCNDLQIPCRIIGLKPRARGSTTYFTAMGYTTMRRTSTSAVFIGGQSDQTVGLWNMMKTYHKNDTFDWKNSGEVNEKGAAFSNGSRAKKETAKDVQAGIGDTYQLLHATEVARWSQYGVANAAAVMSNILKAVPLLAGTYVFLESTAENAGGDYHTRFINAIDGDAFLAGDQEPEFGSYVRVFAGWHHFAESALRLTEEQKLHIQRTLDADDEWHGEKELIELYSHTDENGVVHLGDSVTEYDVWEQLAWRRYSIREECDRDVQIFDRDYPHCWEVAFMKSGKMRFNQTGVSVLRKRLLGRATIHGLLEPAKAQRSVIFRNTDANEAQFTIFEKPTAGYKYIVSADPATGASQTAGLDPDNHGIFCIRAGFWGRDGKWVRPATAARVVQCKWEIDMAALATWKLASYYGGPGGAKIVVEVNMDRGFIEHLKGFGADLYQREFFNRREQKLTNALGYQTNERTRETLITTLASAIREWDTPGHGIDVWCPLAIAQLENFILKDSGRSEAAQGFHDDDVVAIALGLELIEHAKLYAPRHDPFRVPPELRESQSSGAGAYS
jgi:hypothetical protein